MKKIILMLVLVLAFFTSFSQLDSTKFLRTGLSYRWPYGWVDNDFYVGAYGNSVKYTLPTRGVILNDKFNRSSIGASYSVGGTATITFPSSAYMNINGGTSGFTDYFQYDQYYTGDNKWEDSLGIVPQSVASGAFVMIGTHSINTTYKSSFSAYYNLNSGQIVFYKNNSFSNVLATSNSNLSFVAGDSLMIVLGRNLNIFYTTFINVTQGTSIRLSYSYNYSNVTNIQPNIGRFRVYQNGNNSYYKFGINITNLKNTTVVTGNSVEQGQYADANKRWIDILFKDNSFSSIGGSGDKSADLLNNVNNIIALSPKYCVISIGLNDVYNTVPVATYKANLTSIVTSLQAAGIIVFLGSPTAAGLNVSLYVTAMEEVATAKACTFVNLYTATKSSGTYTLNALYNSGDGLHPNTLGHYVIGKTLANSIPILAKGIYDLTMPSLKLDTTNALPYKVGLDELGNLYKMTNTESGGVLDSLAFRYQTLYNSQIGSYNITRLRSNQSNTSSEFDIAHRGSAQSVLSIFGTDIYADPINYNRLLVSNVNSGTFQITTQKAGTAILPSLQIAGGADSISLGNATGINVKGVMNTVSAIKSTVSGGGINSSFFVISNDPSIGIGNSTGATNAKYWDLNSNVANKLQFRIVNDASNTAVPIFEFTRNATTSATSQAVGRFAVCASSITLDPNVLFDVVSQTQGSRPMPSMSRTQWNSVVKVNGLFGYDNGLNKLIYSDGTNTKVLLDSTAADGRYIINPLTTTGDIIYSSSGSTASRLPIGTSNQVLTVSGGIPTWQTPAAGTASSGVYTPTLSIVSNLTSASVLSATYLKIDRIVHVSMQLLLQPTVAGNSTFATITLPFNSSTVYDAGNVTGGAAPTLDAGVAITNSATQMQISLIPTTTSNSSYFVTYQYQTP